MLPRVFEIDEIFRIIATHVVDIDSPSAVALACCCKALEEPVLSLYWEDQPLDRLASVLPTDVLKRSGLGKSPYYVRASSTPQSNTSPDLHRQLTICCRQQSASPPKRSGTDCYDMPSGSNGFQASSHVVLSPSSRSFGSALPPGHHSQTCAR